MNTLPSPPLRTPAGGAARRAAAISSSPRLAVSSSFDPGLPVDGSLIIASELREQFNGLAGMIAAIVPGVTPVEMNAAISGAISYTAQNPSGVQPLNVNYQDPVSAADLNQVKDKLNDLIAALYRAP